VDNRVEPVTRLTDGSGSAAGTDDATVRKVDTTKPVAGDLDGSNGNGTEQSVGSGSSPTVSAGRASVSGTVKPAPVWPETSTERATTQRATADRAAADRAAADRVATDRAAADRAAAAERPTAWPDTSGSSGAGMPGAAMPRLPGLPLPQSPTRPVGMGPAMPGTVGSPSPATTGIPATSQVTGIPSAPRPGPGYDSPVGSADTKSRNSAPFVPRTKKKSKLGKTGRSGSPIENGKVTAPGKASAQSRPAAKLASGGASKDGVQSRDAQLVVSRIEPWSVMKFSFMVSLVGWVVLFVAVAAIYFAFSSLGVFHQIEDTIGLVTSSKTGGGANVSSWFSASTVLGYTMLAGAIDVVLITALTTVGAVVYNLVTHLSGGIEITLHEAD
jgi:Transmembrane domain of unknown function (DUF3566)